ncbi:MAG TPA: NADP-dependent oxidoreductase [Polyangiaceae bacterium]|nr:NADP-dependent oxidoreductase [Polyangiaceae bacterium]
MKAIRIHEYGGPEVLKYEDAPDPRVGADDVLVDVHAAGVNQVDWKVREGWLEDMIRYAMPMIPGWDVSGVVAARGSNVVRFEVGDEVFGRPDVARDGAYAERVAVRATELAIKPASVDHVTAAAAPLCALTAWQALFDATPGYVGAGLAAGQTVLVHAAAGGVGTFAVQLAKWRGARVIGTCSARNLDYVRALGADEVVDYTTGRFEDAVRDVDVVLDTIGGDTQDRSWRVLQKGGILVSIARPPAEEVAESHGVRAGYVFVQPMASQLDQIAALIDAQTLRVEVSNVLPLSSAREAQELSRAGHVRGKVVLDVRA